MILLILYSRKRERKWDIPSSKRAIESIGRRHPAARNKPVSRTLLQSRKRVNPSIKLFRD